MTREALEQLIDQAHLSEKATQRATDALRLWMKGHPEDLEMLSYGEMLENLRIRWRMQKPRVRKTPLTRVRKGR